MNEPAPVTTISRFLRRLAPILLPLIACAIPLGLSVFHLDWAEASPSPAGRDEPLHLRNALVIEKTLEAGDLSTVSIALGDLPARIRQSVYPPGAYLVAAWIKPGLARWVSTDYAGSVCSLTFFAVVLALSVYFAVRRLTGGGNVGAFYGVFAAWSVVLLPLVFEETHQFGPNLPATAMTALCVALFLKSDDLKNARWAALFALACGLAMLTYYTVFVFLAGPVLVSLLIASTPGNKPARARYALSLAAVVAAGILIAAPFYFRADVDTKLLDFAARFFGGIRPVAEESDLPAGSGFFAALFYYPAAFFTKQAGVVTGGLLAIGVLLALGHKAPARWQLLAGAILPVMVFTLFNSKWAERTMPMLPLVVMLAFSGFATVRGRTAAGLAFAFICAMTATATEPGRTLDETQRYATETVVPGKSSGPWSADVARKIEPFQAFTRHLAGKGIGPERQALIAVPHNQMLVEYLAELAGARYTVVQAKTDVDFFLRFDEMEMAVVVRERTGGPAWYTDAYLNDVATMRRDLGPADTAERLAESVATAGSEFAYAGSVYIRGAEYLCYLRRPVAVEQTAVDPGTPIP